MRRRILTTAEISQINDANSYIVAAINLALTVKNTLSAFTPTIDDNGRDKQPEIKHAIDNCTQAVISLHTAMGYLEHIKVELL